MIARTNRTKTRPVVAQLQLVLAALERGELIDKPHHRYAVIDHLEQAAVNLRECSEAIAYQSHCIRNGYSTAVVGRVCDEAIAALKGVLSGLKE